MKRHVKTQHDLKGRHICTDCEKTFASTIALSYHKKRHHSTDSGINCNQCELIFQDFQAYTKHASSHKSSSRSSTSVPEYKCDECHAKFSTNSNMNRHLGEIHNLVNFNTSKIIMKTYPFRCENCGFYTKRKHYFDAHVLLQHGSETKVVLSCPHCPKTFDHKQNLRRHERRYHESRTITGEILAMIVTHAMR